MDRVGNLIICEIEARSHDEAVGKIVGRVKTQLTVLHRDQKPRGMLARYGELRSICDDDETTAVLATTLDTHGNLALNLSPELKGQKAPL